MGIFKKIKKEVGMKKFFVIALALLLAVPAISYAGSATSRWDVTIGGFVKVELGYSDELRANQYWLPHRDSKAQKVAGDEYGNWFMDGVQTRFNFTIKGPDAWGMKTMAFIEGDFYGSGGPRYASRITQDNITKNVTYSTYNHQGAFRLRHAFIKLIDKNFEVTLAGNTTQVFGTLTGMGQALLTLVPWLDTGLSIGAGRVPQFNVEYFAMNRDLAMLFGVFLNNNQVGANEVTGDVNTWTMGGLSAHGRIQYSTAKLGKIGNDKLTFVVDGFYGNEKKAWKSGNTTALSTGTNTSTSWDDKTVKSWGAHGSFFIPILPEKGGNKAGSIGFSAYGYIAQNPGSIGPYVLGTAANSYYRNDGSQTAPTLYGWGPQLYVYLTNNVMLDLIYSDVKANLSGRYCNSKATATTVKRVSQYAAILAYDPNPALKFTLSWDHNYAEYAQMAAGQGKKGTSNVYRFAAFYFF